MGIIEEKCYIILLHTKKAVEVKWKALLLIILSQDSSSHFYPFKLYLYQVILNISVLKLQFLLIKMVTIDSLNFMTDSRRVFLKRSYASVIMGLTHKKRSSPLKTTS
jgi:hypothetical protein